MSETKWRAAQINTSETPWAVIDGNGPHGDQIVAGYVRTESSAHKLAAADDLYEALKGLLAYADHFTTADHGDCTCPHCVARAALRKARGD